MTKPCIYCNQEIELVKTAQGWRPFNPHDLTMHDCPEGKAAREAKKKSGGGGGYQKDSRSIEKQVCLKEAAETWRALYGDNAANEEFKDAMQEIVEGYRLLRDAILEDQEKEKNN